MNLSRTRITPRQLVQQYLGTKRVSQRSLLTALHYACRRGYLPNYIAGASAYDQHMVLLPATSPLAALYRHVAPDGSPTHVPIGLIESRTSLPLSHLVTVMVLARVGLAVVRLAGRCAVLRGTASEMAHEVNVLRYIDSRPRPCWMAIERATGLVVPPAEISDDLRLRTAELYDEYELDALGLLDGEPNATIVSRWRFTPQPQVTPPSSDMRPPF